MSDVTTDDKTYHLEIALDAAVIEIRRLRAALREILQLTVDHTYSDQVAEIAKEALGDD